MKQRRAERVHAFHRSRIEATVNPKDRVSAITDYLLSVLTSMPARQADELVQRFTEETLELVEVARHMPDETG